MSKLRIKEDPRLKRATKEFLVMISVGFILYSIPYWAILLTYGSNPHAVVAGFPWWFNLLWVSLAFMVILLIITHFMKEEPLDPWLKEGG